MVIVNLDKVTKIYGTHVVFEGVSWEIRRGVKIGLVGPNGSGKSTLFRLIAGHAEPDAGSVYRLPGLTIGYLAQEPALAPSATVIDEVMSASSEIAELSAEMRRLEARMGEPRVYNHPRKLQRTLDAHERVVEAFEAAGGFNYRSRVESTLRGLRFAESDFERRIDELSGGQKKLVGLAKLLVTQPDLLLLDEPDNHLDLEGKEFLEQLIRGYPGTVVIVSHDRYLLDNVAEEIADLEDGWLTVYPDSNYSAYDIEKRARLLRQQQLYQAQQKEIARIEAAIVRFEHWAHIVDDARHARQARNKRKLLERMDKIERPNLDRRTMGLELRGRRGSDKVLEIRDLDMAFGDDLLFAGLNLILWTGERAALVGPNGAGKSVLFHIILGQQEPSGGTVKIGPSITVGYYAQEHQTLDLARTLVEEVRLVKPMYESDAYGFLGKFLFDYEMARKPISTLSGGEKSRLQLAKLMLAEPNFLLLDEPTNNLDIRSIDQPTLEFIACRDRVRSSELFSGPRPLCSSRPTSRPRTIRSSKNGRFNPCRGLDGAGLGFNGTRERRRPVGLLGRYDLASTTRIKRGWRRQGLVGFDGFVRSSAILWPRRWRVDGNN